MSLFEQSVLVAVVVAIVMLIQDRLGAIAGGFLAAAPTVSGPSFLLAAKAQPDLFASETALSALLASGLSSLCLLCFIVLVHRVNARVAAVLSLAMLFALAGLLQAFSLSALMIMLLSGIMLAAAYWLNPKPVGVLKPVVMPRRVKVICSIGAGLLLVGGSISAAWLGSYWVGIITAMPSISIIVGIAVAEFAGTQQARQFIRGCWYGLACKGAFFLSIWFMLTVASLPLSVATIGGLLTYSLMFALGSRSMQLAR